MDEPQPSRSTWLIIASSMAIACVIYAFVLYMILRTPSATPALPASPAARVAFWCAAAVALVASMLWTHLRLRVPIGRALRSEPDATLPGTVEFQTASIVSLALAEAACVFGFVEGILFRTPLPDYVPFGIAGLAVIVFDIVPLGLSYWTAWENRQRDRQGGPLPR